MMPCNPRAAAALFPTTSPFMRAGMKCEALGINSTTELPTLQWPRASERRMDGHGSQGDRTRCSLGVRLFVCPLPLQLAGLSSPARQDTLGGLSPANLCLRNHRPDPGVPVRFGTAREPHHQNVQREKAILQPEEQSLPEPPSHSTENPASALVEGRCMGCPRGVCAGLLLPNAGAPPGRRYLSLHPGGAWHPAWAGN